MLCIFPKLWAIGTIAPKGVATGWTWVDISTPPLPEVVHLFLLRLMQIRCFYEGKESGKGSATFGVNKYKE